MTYCTGVGRDRIKNHQKLIKTIERFSLEVSALAPCKEKKMFEDVVGYLIELQTIKAKTELKGDKLC
jgi:hypothetical protein